MKRGCRVAVRAVLAVLTAAVTVAVTPPGAGLAAVNRPHGLTIAGVAPAHGAVVGVAHPVVLTFPAPVTDRRAVERALPVTSVPPMTGSFDWIDDRVAEWIPDRYWPPHSRVAVSVGGLSTEFSTGPQVVAVATISDHTLTVTIDGVDAEPPPRLPAPHHRPHWGEEGVLPASMGKPEFPTPTGNYRVLSKDDAVTMDSSTVGIPVHDPEGYLLSVDHAVRISRRGLFVHSAPWAVNALGIENTSHGCIGLSPTDAEWYYATVNVGDPVIVRD